MLPRVKQSNSNINEARKSQNKANLALEKTDPGFISRNIKVWIFYFGCKLNPVHKFPNTSAVEEPYKLQHVS